MKNKSENPDANSVIRGGRNPEIVKNIYRGTVKRSTPKKSNQKLAGGVRKLPKKIIVEKEGKGTEKQRKALLEWLGGEGVEGKTENLAKKFGETRAEQKLKLAEMRNDQEIKERKKLVREKVQKIESGGRGAETQRGPLLKTGVMAEKLN